MRDLLRSGGGLRRGRWRGIVGLLPALLVALGCQAALAGPPVVHVYAASSLADAIDPLARAYAKSGRAEVVPTYGNSGDLALKIEQDAAVETATKADMFLSAEDRWMEYLQARQLIRDNTVVRFVYNELVLVAPAGSDIALKIRSDFPLAAALGGGSLALPNSTTAPEGRLARTALEALGVWSSVLDHLRETDDVRSALTLVAAPKASLGIGYASDVAAVPGLKLVDAFPSETYTPIDYPMALVRGDRNPAAGGFLKFLRSKAAAAVFTQHGFRIKAASGGS